MRYCSNSQRVSYGGDNGYNGIWKIERKSGDNPEITVSWNGVEKFQIQLSSYCSYSSWADHWKEDVASLYFHLTEDKASVEFRASESGNLCATVKL